MSITFKEFAAAVQLSDEEFSKIEEGLSDVPGFAWLKNVGNNPAKKKAALAKIDAERQRLMKMKDAKSKALDAAFAKAKGEIEGGAGKKGAISHDDLDQALGADDRKFNSKMDRARDQSHLAHREKNLGRLSSVTEAKEAGTIVTGRLDISFIDDEDSEESTMVTVFYDAKTPEAAQKLAAKLAAKDGQNHEVDNEKHDDDLYHMAQNVFGGGGVSSIHGPAFLEKVKVVGKEPAGRKVFYFDLSAV